MAFLSEVHSSYQFVLYIVSKHGRFAVVFDFAPKQVRPFHGVPLDIPSQSPGKTTETQGGEKKVVQEGNRKDEL
jgi:hypothetical protein